MFGREAEPFETRDLARITDIGLAFEERIKDLTGILDLDIAAVFRARQLTADTVASLPMRQVFGNTVTDQTPRILTEPDPTETYHDTLTSIMLSLIDSGNASFWVNAFDERGLPDSIYVIDQDEVTVEWDDRQLFRTYAWRNVPMDEGRDFFHISINRRKRDLKGRGVIEAARDTTIATLKAQTDMARSIADDNYTPTLVIKHPSVRTKKDADEVRDAFIGNRPNSRARNRPSVMSADAELDQLTINPVDAQWVESRQFEIQETARLFGLPGWFMLVDQGSSMTYSNTEGVMRFWATTTLRPTYLERIEQTFSRLLPTGTRARFDLDEILRADIEARYRANRIGIQSRFLLPNEARESEGLPPIESGDRFPDEVDAELVTEPDEETADA